MKSLLIVCLFLALVSALVPIGDVWPMSGKDIHNTYQTDYVTNHNFNNLSSMMLSWSYLPPAIPGQPFPASFSANPTIFNGVLYAADTLGRVYAFDLENGTLFWYVMLSTNISDLGKIEQFQTSPVIVGDRLLISYRHIFALNRFTGALFWSESLSGDLTSVGPDGKLTDYYTYCGNIGVIDVYAVVGVASTQNEITPSMLLNVSNTKLTARGSVVAFNIFTGEIMWRFYTTSNQSSPNPLYGPGVSVWSSPSFDILRQTVYIGTGQSFQPPVSPYSDSILALNYITGTLLWSSQGKANDTFNDISPNYSNDRDFSTHPSLMTILVKLNGDLIEKFHDFVGIGSKNGNYYLYNREQPSINATAINILQLDFGGPIGGLQGTPSYKDGVLYIPSHAVIDEVTGVRRGFNNSNPYDTLYFSARITAVDVAKAVKNESYIIWQYSDAITPANLGLKVNITFSSLTLTQDILMHTSYGGYINFFRNTDGAVSPFYIETGSPMVAAMAVAQGHYCTGSGITFLGQYYQGKILCYV